MANVMLPEKNILPIRDIEQSAIRRADEGTLKLLQGGTSIQYSPMSRVHLSGQFAATTISGHTHPTSLEVGDTHRRTKRHALVEPMKSPSVDQEIHLPTVNERLKILDWYFLSAREFYILYADNPVCWRWTKYQFFEAAELLQSDSMELKGVIGKEQFIAGKKYDVEFLIRMDMNAELNTKSRFTAVLPELEGKCSIHSKLVNLKEQVTANEWMFVKVGDFTATENGEHIRFSLTNFDQYWKKGLTVAGVLVHPSTIT